MYRGRTQCTCTYIRSDGAVERAAGAGFLHGEIERSCLPSGVREQISPCVRLLRTTSVNRTVNRVL